MKSNLYIIFVKSHFSSLFGPVGSDLKSKATVSIETKPISKVGPSLEKKEADKKLDLDTDEVSIRLDTANTHTLSE